MDGIDPDRLADALRVLAEVEGLPPEHPDAIAVRRAVGRLFKAVKEQRRAERRAAIRAHDEAVTAATATGAPGRVDDETQGLPLLSRAGGGSAGTLVRSRACYVCKQRFRDVDAFYHQLCPDCAARNHARRAARTDLRGRRALLTGGRAKIGMYIALRLLRDGAHTTITTRFPDDAVRRFSAMEDSAGGSTGCASWASTCAIPPRSSRSPTTSPPAVRSTSSSTTPRRPCAARPRRTRTSRGPRGCRSRPARSPRS